MHESPLDDARCRSCILAVGSVVAGYAAVPGRCIGTRLGSPALVQPVFRAAREAHHAHVAGCRSWRRCRAVARHRCSPAYLYLRDARRCRARLARAAAAVRRACSRQVLRRRALRRASCGASWSAAAERVLWTRRRRAADRRRRERHGARWSRSLAARAARRSRPASCARYALLILGGAVAAARLPAVAADDACSLEPCSRCCVCPARRRARSCVALIAARVGDARRSSSALGASRSRRLRALARAACAASEPSAGHAVRRARAVDARARASATTSAIDGLSPLARDPDHVPDAARACSAPGRRSTTRVREFIRLHAAARDGHARRLRRARPVPLLRVLGGDADPDVLPDRDLGRTSGASTPRSSSSSTRWPAAC